MAYNYEYPYTDMHRHNDDWMINRVKELSLEWLKTQQEWNNTQEEFTSLKTFIQNYFAELDVQDEVNTKLDIMACDGSLSALISPLFDEYQQNINVLSTRMNAFTRLGEGATTGDAEITDARIDHTGKEWANVGEHVRAFESQLSSEIATQSMPISIAWEQGNIRGGVDDESTLRIRSNFYSPNKHNDDLYIDVLSGYKVICIIYDMDKNFVSQTEWLSESTDMVLSYPYYRFLIAKSDDTTIYVEDAKNVSLNINIPFKNQTLLNVGTINEMYLIHKIRREFFENGGLNGVAYPYTKNTNGERKRTVEFYVKENTVIRCENSLFKFGVCGVDNYIAMGTEDIVIPKSQYIRLVIGKTNDTSITDSEYKEIINAFTVINPNPFYEHSEDLPDYYSNKISNFTSNIMDLYGIGEVNYLFITDLHIDQNSNSEKPILRQLQAVVDIANNSNIDFVVVGGDLILGHDSTNREAMALIKKQCDALQKCKKPVFVLKGNHDYNSFASGSDAWDSNHIIPYSMWYANAIERFENENFVYDSQNSCSTYWYYDLPKKKTRLVFLDTSDWYDTWTKANGQSYLGFSDKQCEWFVNDALNKSENGWKYLIFGHAPIDTDYTCWDIIPENSEVVFGAINALNNKGNLSSGNYTKDFSEYNSKVYAYHFGHTHADLLVRETASKMVYICTRCALPYAEDKTLEELQINNSNYHPPLAGEYETISESAFDWVKVSNSKISVTRFGNGNDREILI